MSNFIQVTPFMVVDDLERAISFFTHILAFKVLYRSHDYAYVQRETAAFRILEQKGPEGAPLEIGASPITLTCATSTAFTPN